MFYDNWLFWVLVGVFLFALIRTMTHFTNKKNQRLNGLFLVIKFDQKNCTATLIKLESPQKRRIADENQKKATEAQWNELWLNLCLPEAFTKKLNKQERLLTFNQNAVVCVRLNGKGPKTKEEFVVPFLPPTANLKKSF